MTSTNDRFAKKVKEMRNLCLLAGCLLILAARPLIMAQESDVPIDAYKKKAQDISREIEKGRAKIQKFTHKESDIIQQLNRADRKLDRSRKRTAGLSREIERLNRMIADSTAASENLAQQIKANEQYVAKRLVALYKLNRLGKFQVLASAENLQALLQRKRAIEQILAQDEQVIKELVNNRREFEIVRSQLEANRNKKRRQSDTYRKHINRMATELKERSQLLAYVRKEKSAQLAAIESLKQAARDLDEKIKNLGTGDHLGIPDEYQTGESFGAYKGLLKLPVKGKIVSLFGEFKNTRYQVLNFRSGIEIQTDRGEPIQAVYDGKVLYADWFKGYGNMIIIDHGDNYYTVYAHIEEAFKSSGDSVERGEVIATVGDTGSISGPKLYFEVRHHGKPLDPMQWIESG
ncbi:MAG: peptidoglycan DD-metalloendopeptidase family protein [Deltaproteobacteria bacterium]|jgi:septal ring factor EnvC (AmiA/AmiB activator)|nr:peptidoglycan DD-metalloendopeptidase family protein [Deltaproteobacteria bacterium]MBW2516304.1 peptidoglycan DD-metalloendopeptidase family protein [Deltaproteobacteria bacterium]